VKLLEKLTCFKFSLVNHSGPGHYRKFVEENHEEGLQRLVVEFFYEDPL
jgi:hypothetical protein